MDLNVKNRRLFNRFDNAIFKKLGVADRKLFLNGSYRHPVFSLFSADVDLYQALKESDRSSLKQKLKSIIQSPQFNEVKYGENKYVNPNIALKHLNLVESSDRVKVDMHVFYQGFIEEVTIIYDFQQPITSSEFIEGMNEDIKKFRQKKMLFKAIKRTKLLFESIRDNQGLQKMNSIILDPKNGFLYVTIQRLHALIDGKASHDNREIAYDNLKDSVRRLGLLDNSMINLFGKLTKTNVGKLIEKLQIILNSQVRKHF